MLLTKIFHNRTTPKPTTPKPTTAAPTSGSPTKRPTASPTPEVGVEEVECEDLMW